MLNILEYVTINLTLCNISLSPNVLQSLESSFWLIHLESKFSFSYLILHTQAAGLYMAKQWFFGWVMVFSRRSKHLHF